MGGLFLFVLSRWLLDRAWGAVTEQLNKEHDMNEKSVLSQKGEHTEQNGLNQINQGGQVY